MNITKKIQKLRIEKGWTVSKLARETDIPVISLRTMLNRQEPNNYNIKNLIKIAGALGVTVSYLTMEENESEKPVLTLTQKAELKKIIEEAIENYFTLVKPSEDKNSDKNDEKTVDKNIDKTDNPDEENYEDEDLED